MSGSWNPECCLRGAMCCSGRQPPRGFACLITFPWNVLWLNQSGSSESPTSVFEELFRGLHKNQTSIMHVGFIFGWAIVASPGSKILKVQSWIVPGGKSSFLRRPSGANKAGLFSPFKSPRLAEVTDLQLRYGPNSYNYIYIVLWCSCSVCGGLMFPRFTELAGLHLKTS